jgi:hypothetical protein
VTKLVHFFEIFIPKNLRVPNATTNATLGAIVILSFVIAAINYFSPRNSGIFGTNGFQILGDFHKLVIEKLVFGFMNTFTSLWNLLRDLISDEPLPPDVDGISITDLFSDGVNQVAFAITVVIFLTVASALFYFIYSRFQSSPRGLSKAKALLLNRFVPSMIPYGYHFGKSNNQLGFVSVPGIFQKIQPYADQKISYSDLVGYLRFNRYIVVVDKHGTIWVRRNKL